MAGVIASRGPDAFAMWRDGEAAIGFAHRRLAIIDLSHAADQPMTSGSGRYTICYNGEIYNFRELRAELVKRGVVMRTQGDTEVILELFALDGPGMLNRLRGMYAFAIWDAEEQSLFLARDPYGIKPLYYAEHGRQFSFASQVRALLQQPAVDTRLDAAGYAGFRLWGSVPQPFTMFRGVHNLPGGHWLKVGRNGGALTPVPFDSLGAQYAKPPATTVDDIRDAVRESVRQHLVADVEVGCFLSGGIDSSALVGLMRDCGQDRIRTFTIDFDEFRGTEKDETPYAALVAAHYRTDHHVERITRRDFEDSQSAILAAMDQPSIDGVNTWFVSRAVARAGIKVAMSGIGGDELFCGYSTFSTVPRMVRQWRRMGMVPGLQSAASALPLLFKAIGGKQPKAMHYFKHSATLASAYILRRSLVAPEDLGMGDDAVVIVEGLQRLDVEQRLAALVDGLGLNSQEQVAMFESTHYLGNQLLRDTDWTSMAHSIEVRTPLVDIALLRAVAPHQPSFNLKSGKKLLAHAPHNALPEAIINRRKMGFSIPVDQWTRGREQEGAQLGGWSDRLLEQYANDTGLNLPDR